MKTVICVGVKERNVQCPLKIPLTRSSPVKLRENLNTICPSGQNKPCDFRWGKLDVISALCNFLPMNLHVSNNY